MNTKIPILKRLDNLLGLPLVNVSYLFIKPKRDPALHPCRFLIIRPGGIGDAVLLIPAILAVKKAFPDAIVDILAERRNEEVFSLCPQVGRVFHYDTPKELIAAVRGKYDVVIDTEQWHRLSAVVARLTRAPLSIGYGTNERKKLFTYPLPYSHDDYEVYSFLNLVFPIIGKVEFNQEEPFLVVPAESFEKVEPLFSPLKGKRIVTIFPSGSIRERQWGSKRFHEVAGFLSRQGCGIVVVGGKGDVSQGCEIVAGLPNAVNLTGELSLCETAAVLKETALLISGDSGIMHIAYGLGVKTLALFGPGIEKKWAPRVSNSVIINKRLECSPCTRFGYTPKCNKDAECMKLITVDEVFKKATELLKE